MFRSISLKLADQNHTTRRGKSAYASYPSWFRIIGKVVSAVRKSVPKRAF